MSKSIRFESRRVGEVEVIEDDIVRFEPLPGFPDRTRFVLMEHADQSEMAWLVSVDDPDLAFVVASPWTFFPQYDPPVEREHLAALGIEKREEVEILCIVTLVGQRINLNLAAPLLINAASRSGIQVVSDDPRYTTRAPIPELVKAAKEEEKAAPSETRGAAAGDSPSAAP